MRNMVLMLSIVALVFSLINFLSYISFSEINIGEIIHSKVSREKMQDVLNNSLHNDNVDDAIMYLKIAKKHNYKIDIPAYQQAIDQQNTKFQQMKRKTKQFASGFIKGEGTTVSEISGAVTSDFTVVGDLRDIKKEYDKQKNNQQVDQLVVCMAGTGIALTVATYASAGASGVAKVGTSIIKLAAKSKKLTPSFSKELIQQSKNVFDFKTFIHSIKSKKLLDAGDIKHYAKKSFNKNALTPLKKSATSLYKIKKNTNIADTLAMLKYVDNTKDLKTLQRFTSKYKNLSKGYLKLMGKGALRTVKTIIKTAGFITSIIMTIMSMIFTIMSIFMPRGRSRNLVNK